MKKLLQSLFILMCIASTAMAQERTITGKVTSQADGNPVPNASVIVKGTKIYTQTSSNGSYSIKVPGSSSILVFTYLGFGTQEFSASDKAIINVVLEDDAKQLDEVVVSYGTAKKSTFIGSAAQIDNAAFENRPITNILNAVTGAAPGIQTTSAGGAPGSGAAIRIRGFGSISASNGALLVVDGAVYDGGTANLDPNDVESVSLLKDAATTALYGSRAGNGVVLITTKKGKAGRETLSFKANTGWISRGLPEYDRLDANQYYPVMWEVLRNSLQYGSLAIPRATANGIASGTITSYNGSAYTGIRNLLGINPYNVADNQIVLTDGTLNPNASLLYGDDLDWADQASQGGKQRQNYSMTYSGGTGKTDYFGSFNYTNEQGYLIASSLKRFNGRLNVNTQPVKWFKTGMNLSGNYNKSLFDNVGDGGSAFINPFYISRFIGPIYPVHLHDASGALVLDANGNSQYDFGATRPFSAGRHTIFENLNDTQDLVRGAISARTYATVYIMKGLKATTNLNFDFQDNQERAYDNPTLGDGAPAGRAYQYSYRTTTYTFNQLLEYTKSFGKHNLNVLAGHENYSYMYNYLSGSRSGLIVQGISELVNFATVLGTTSYQNDATVESYLSRLNYDYDGKYLLSASLRRDGNSKFDKSVRWDNFWSVGAGWNIHKESFFKANWVNQLKVRSSYGVLGNAEGLGNYPYQALYTLGRNNQSEAGFTQSALANPLLTWETSKNFDVGIDYSLINNRISGSIEYFNRVTDGLIFDVQQPLSNGGTTAANFSIPTNIGSLYNRGGEISITGQIIKSKDFTYSATLNLTKFKNELTKLPPGQNLIQSGTKAYSVGHSIYDFYLREFAGVDPATGAALYKTNTLTTNAKIVGQDTVTTVIGEANYRYTGDSSIPDVYGSMTHNFGYKNFSLGVTFTFQSGGKVYDSAYASLMHGGTYGTALSTDILSRWQNPGDVTNVPRLDNNQITNFTGASTRWLTSASYFQLNSVVLSYSLPKTWMTKIGASNASIYASGENLALLSSRKGMDVTGSFNGTVGNNYNFTRTVSIGVNVNF